jgi:tripartite ATP-independent transporter DctM subunit
MDPQTILFIFGAAIIGLIVILAIGVPIAFAIGLVVIALILIEPGPSGLFILASVAYDISTGITLLAVPAFILMAELIIESGVSSRAFTAASKWLGWLPGGLATACVGASALTAATIGSSVANTATIGLIATKEMETFGYDRKLAVGSIMGGGALGILIPPSLTFIIFGIATEQSIAHLFMGGILPGIALAFLFIIYITLRASINPNVAPRTGEATWSERWVALVQMIPLIFLACGLLYFIYFGIATPTEVGALGSMVGFIFCLFNRKVSWSSLKRVGLHTISTSAMIIWLVIAAMSLGHIAAVYGVSEALIEFITTITSQKYVVLFGINLLLLVLGCFLDPAAIIMITTPFLMPIIQHYGFDPLWFGVMFMVNMEMGYITPPLGFNLFVMKKIAPHVPMEMIVRATIPFMICQAMTIALLVVFPQLALWIPSMMQG